MAVSQQRLAKVRLDVILEVGVPLFEFASLLLRCPRCVCPGSMTGPGVLFLWRYRSGRMIGCKSFLNILGIMKEEICRHDLYGFARRRRVRVFPGYDKSQP